MARIIPESIRMKLKKRLEESRMSGGSEKKKVIDRVRERLRARFKEARKSNKFDTSYIDRIRRRLEERMSRRKGGSVLREKLRERLRRRLENISEHRESRIERGYDVADRIRRRLEERMSRRKGGSVLREKLRERLNERRGSGLVLREKLRERLRRRLGNISEHRESSIVERMRERIRARRLGEGRIERGDIADRIRRRLEERMSRYKGGSEMGEGSVSDEVRRLVRAKKGLYERIGSLKTFPMTRLSDTDYDEEGIENVLGETDRLLGSGHRYMKESINSRKLEIYKKALSKLKEESERRKLILKEAYKVVKRVEELGGIDKIEKSLKLAHDAIIKAGSKMFKEAVDKIAVEAGVGKEEAAKILRKLGLKEAKEVLKKGGKKIKEKKTEVIPVSGLVKEEGISPVIAKRLAERLSGGPEANGLVNLKEMTEATFGRKLG